MKPRYYPSRYAKKTEAQLLYIMSDAHEAARCMRGMDTAAECKYLDQMNDAASELHRRRELAKAKAERR